ncbi:MAG: erythromycin biosynthesis sensory transduction protein EryC1, partial [Actinomycetia bacterium]|nr:erythromycin biosynthesis sensory transduction protein EryC1 [Actinomycetes bacterium]
GARLVHLDADNARRRAVAAAYDAGLAGSAVRTPVVRDGATHVYHQYVVRVADRQGVRDDLAAAGIGTAVHYPEPVHVQPAYRTRLARPVPLPVTEAISGEILSLPMYPQLPVAVAERVAGVLRARCP